MRLVRLFGVAVAMMSASMLLPQAASAQLFLNDPDFKAAPMEASDPAVGLPLPGATPAEYAAHLNWNLRAGLNVAALQCQFAPFLRTVGNYNGILAHHSKELMESYTALGAYFKRKHGAREGQRLFDDYSTQTYNNFSTLYAQYGFCQVAGDIAKEVLAQPKGSFHVTARARMRELRNSLVPAVDRIAIFNPYLIRLPAMPELREVCYERDRRGRPTKNAKAAQPACAPVSLAANAAR